MLLFDPADPQANKVPLPDAQVSFSNRWA